MSELGRIEKKLYRHAARAVHDFGMIEAGDRVCVALSGGKDSWALLHLLHRLRRAAPVPFEVTAVTLHPGFPGFEPAPISRYCAEMGFPHFTEPTPIHEILEEKKTALTDYCAFCARFRRGILYTLARREGFTKIALGHHADDLIETLLMAQFFTGEIKSMPPLLRADDGVNVVIRPLCYLFEAEIVRWSDLMGFPIVGCGCPVGDAPHKMRLRVKTLLRDLEAEHPGIKANLLSSLGRVRLRYLMPGRFGDDGMEGNEA